MKKKYGIYLLGASLLCAVSMQNTVVSASDDTLTVAPSRLLKNNYGANTENYWDNAQWTFSSNGVFTITGGTIDLDNSVSPWRLGMIPISAIKEIKVEDTVYLKGNATGLFLGVSNLEKINAENLNVDEVTSMNLMFSGLSKLTSINLSTWNTRNVSESLGMFGSTRELKEITLGPDSIFPQNIMVDSTMEGYTSRLVGTNTGKIYQSSFDLITNYDGTAPDTFVREKIKEVEENSWGTANYEFNGTTLTVSGGSINLNNDDSPWNKDINSTEIKSIYFTDTVYLEGDASYLFASLPNLTQANLENVDVSQVTSTKGMFFNTELISFNVDEWDVSNVTDMSYMFHGVQSLRELNLEQWNTSNVTNMSSMFTNTRFLQKLYISQWDVSNVTDMSYMLMMTTSLEHVDVSTWNLSDKNVSGMFLGSAYK